MNFLTEEQQAWKDSVRRWVDREVGARGLPCRKEVAMAKLFASETLQTVTRHGMQILGGYGMTPQGDMERYFREGMQSTVGGGTSQIQRTIIAQEMRA